MLSSKTELKNAVASFLKTSPNRLQYIPLSVNNSMSGQIEDGFDGSIFCLSDSDTDYIVKLKSNSFIENVGETMNYFHSAAFADAYKKGYGIFYIRESYRREKYIYERLDDPLRSNLPKYFGSLVHGSTCAHIMERLQICQTPVQITDSANFAAKLHAHYLNSEEEARKLHANFPTSADYENAVSLSHILLNNISEFSILPCEILYDMHKFVDRPLENYTQLNMFPRTLCHGDFCVKNLTFLQNDVCVYDWELATYNNPEFDLVSFLVHYPTKIDDSIISEFLNGYRRCFSQYSEINIPENEFRDSLTFNLRLYMATRFHAMINIGKRVSMPYLPNSIYNWVYLYRYFNQNPANVPPITSC